MPRGVKRQRAHQPVLPLTDPYPEHAKLYPHTQANWEIREFLYWLRYQPEVRDFASLSFDETTDLLLKYRGVDVEAYEAEAADLKSKYRWLWNTFEAQAPKPPEPTPVEPLPALPKPEPLPQVKVDPLQDLLSKVRKGRDATQD